MLAEAAAELCACDVPHRAVVADAADPDALLTALRCAGIQDLEVCAARIAPISMRHIMMRRTWLPLR